MKILPPYPDHILRLMSAKDRPAGPGGKTREDLLMDSEIKSERQLQDKVASLLRLRNIVFDVDRMDKSRGGTVGWPDFTFAVAGKACAFECKMPGNRLSVEQEQVQGQMWSNGWRVATITSVHEAKVFLDAIENGSDV